MFKRLVLALLIVSAMMSAVPASAVRVRGYRRKDGVYVRSHRRRSPRRYRRRRCELPAELEARALAAIREIQR